MARADAQDGTTQPLQIWLFGGLGMLCRERPLSVEAVPGSTVGELLHAVSDRLEGRLAEMIIDTARNKLGICRVFLNGIQV